MVRKSFCAGFSCLAGLIFACIGWGNNNLTFALFAFGVGAILFLMSRNWRKYVVLCTISFLIGIGVNTLYTHFHYDKLISLDGKTVTMQGYIKDFAYVGEGKCRITVSGRLNGCKTDVDFFVEDNDFDYCDEVEIVGKVYKITDSINYLGETYKRPKGVFLKGGRVEKAEISGENANLIFREILHFRDYTFNKITNTVKGDAGAFLGAMLCGDKSELSESRKATFYRSGIGHIFAVSGTHLVLITSAFSVFLSKIVHSKKLKFWLLMPIVWGFAVFAGLSPSVVRAAVMMTIMKGSCLFLRESDPANTLGFAGIILTIFSPYTVADISFLMSFTATFAVSVVAPKFAEFVPNGKIYSAAAKSFIVSCTILLVTMPLSVFFFGGASVISPISNVILLPICTTALLLTFVAVFPVPNVVSAMLFAVAKALVNVVLKVAEWLSELSFAYISAHGDLLKIVILVTCLIPIIVVIYRKNLKFGVYAVVTMLMIWCVTANIEEIISENNIKILILPDGNNSQTAVIKNGKAVLLDMNCKGENNAGMQRLVTEFAVEKIYCEFVCGGGVFANITMENFIPAPQKYAITGVYEYDSEKAVPFEVGSSMEFDGIEISLSDNGYVISESGNSVLISGSKVTLDNKEYVLSNEDYPCEILIYEHEVRRLDYGFGESD